MDNCFREVVPFSEKWLAGCLCKSIDKTISEIEVGGMPALSVSTPPGTSNIDLDAVDGHEFNAEPMNKEIQLATNYFAATSF